MRSDHISTRINWTWPFIASFSCHVQQKNYLKKFNYRRSISRLLKQIILSLNGSITPFRLDLDLLPYLTNKKLYMPIINYIHILNILLVQVFESYSKIKFCILCSSKFRRVYQKVQNTISSFNALIFISNRSYKMEKITFLNCHRKI